MKNKFENQENGSMLGTTIQQVRKAKGITQEDLGKRVGLPKSSISKIEKGLTHISFEDASLLMDAMGEKISIQVMGMKEPDEKRVERVRFVTIGVMWPETAPGSPITATSPGNTFIYPMIHPSISNTTRRSSCQ